MPAGPEAFAAERLAAATEIDAQEALPGEVEADARQDERLRAVLDPILGVHAPDEWRDALEPGVTLLVRVELHLRVLPRAGQADTVHERGVHLEAAVEVLDVPGDAQPPGVVGIARLRAQAVPVGALEIARVAVHQRAAPLEAIAVAHGDVRRRHAVVRPA